MIWMNLMMTKHVEELISLKSSSQISQENCINQLQCEVGPRKGYILTKSQYYNYNHLILHYP